MADIKNDINIEFDKAKNSAKSLNESMADLGKALGTIAKNATEVTD